jgi:hypothetical protein
MRVSCGIAASLNPFLASLNNSLAENSKEIPRMLSRLLTARLKCLGFVSTKENQPAIVLEQKIKTSQTQVFYGREL